MDSVKCVCLMVFCLGAMAGLIEASPFSPISKFLPGSVKALEKPPHVEGSTQEDGVKLTGGVLGMPFKAIEDVSGKFNDAISNGMGHNGHEEPEKHEEQNVGEERHEVQGKQQEGHGEQHEGQERFGEIKERVNDPPAVLKDLKSELPTDKLSTDKVSDVVETVVEKVPVQSIIPKGDEEIKSRQRRNLPIPSTKVINSRPMVEPRYAVDSAPEPSSGGFLEGAKGIVIDEPDALEQGNNRPVIIYVNSVKRINLDSGSECRNCE